MPLNDFFGWQSRENLPAHRRKSIRFSPANEVGLKIVFGISQVYVIAEAECGQGRFRTTFPS